MSGKKIFQAAKPSLVFLFFLAIFLAAHFSYRDFWTTDDAYYHAKHAYLMQESGDWRLVKPWLEFHFFNYAPTDPWWGYHVILALFIRFFGLVAGTKIFAAALSSLVLTVFYFILRKFSVARPFVWTLLFFVSSAFFLFRLMVERPYVLALSILPLAAYFTLRKKNLALFCLSVIFALLYNLSPLIISVAIFYLVAGYYSRREIDFKPLIATGGGVLAGILLHPHGLNYLNVIVIHLWRVLYLKARGIDLGVGNELQTLDFLSFLKYNFLAVAGFLAALSVFLSLKKYWKDFTDAGYLFLVSSAWFAVTLVIPRGADFWLPFAWLFIALTIQKFAETGEFAAARAFIRKKVKHRIVFAYTGIIVVIVALNNFAQTAGNKFDQLRSREQYVYYQQPADWLEANSPRGSVVFYDNWSYWPKMFFYNDRNHYVLGMDPTFLYEYDERLYWLWNNISLKGQYCDRKEPCLEIRPKDKIGRIRDTIKQEFNSSLILAENNPDKPFHRILANRTEEFEKVFENRRFSVFRIK